ncbi:Leucine-rich repeat (LRR) family protein [Raphanus sativus]|uniref:DNA damage-repair/toleration protein DRT100-like n=1 Tax=Raphanus sativus TaxID=3726 RepID=A0A6J0L5Q3_RAPSA|nr:DNA damage-repair/toleration protein DRT100-like [Raphanus sativus]KAJ4876172.1 Leucine-rich repeat (LRR) family protein [Raphanus sativus]
MNSFHLLIFSVVILFRCLNPTRAANCNPDDEAGLLAFKSGITKDPSGILSSWKNDTSCCSWDGVNCRNNDRVVTLTVNIESVDAGIFLAGTISPSLAKLQHLEGLVFINLKNITGPFPRFLFRLPRLEYVYLENSRLSGPLPVNIGSLSHLDMLTVKGNQFTGPIPKSISNLTRLNYLNLGGNLLTGTIPLGIGNLKLMSNLNLDDNRLSGTIPNIFKPLTKLRVLTLSRNGFSGTLPPSIASLAPVLAFLELSQNNLSGSIPSYLSRFKSLDTLDLSKNRFSGAVPKSLSKLTKIANINLSHNLLTDPFPVMNVKDDILTLDLSYNKFQMKKIPDWITSTSLLYSLKLANCGIKMRLDDWKPTRTDHYVSIDLSENDIRGSPATLFKEEHQLREFRASGNKLRFDMEKLSISKSLETLDLSRNLVFGKVPVTVDGLKRLNLSQNHLCGKLPVTKFPASAFAGNKDCLCGYPLAPCKG